MSERLKEPVLKTGDAKASVGSNPTLSAKLHIGLQKYPSGRRGSPAKGVGWLKPGARVQIPPSAPDTRNQALRRIPGIFLRTMLQKRKTDVQSGTEIKLPKLMSGERHRWHDSWQTSDVPPAVVSAGP